MRYQSLLPVTAIAALLVGCTDDPPATAAPASSPTTFEHSQQPETANPAEPPKETAESAAAAAPECKEISETKPGACDPAATKPSPPAQ